jgi:23S rRNA (cytosine1962-C5)-methyltransferase
MTPDPVQQLPLADLWLRKGGDKRLRGGHCWVYSNEVDSERCKLADYRPGALVTVRASNGDALASAYMEPQSLICARIYSRRGGVALDQSLLEQRLGAALQLRERLFDLPYYRLVYGDSDGLSGVVVDRFGDYLVLQINNAGMECHEQVLLAAMVETLNPKGILLRADSRARREDGLESRVEVVYGNVPEQVPLEENGVRFLAPVQRGQKTGWFYDHRDNRNRLRGYVAGKRVLDVYSYIGGWGVQAAVFGATEVLCVDSSAPALAGVEENALLNGVGELMACRQGAADKVLQALAAEGEQFDVVVLDPPAFVQRRRDLAKGRKAYRRINELALALLAPGGILFSASCSMHLSRLDLLEEMQSAARRAGRCLQVLEFGHQGRDHPVHPAIPETDYLKVAVAIVTNED